MEPRPYCVEVLVDKAPARLGSHSYLSAVEIPLGSAVEVPFGNRIANAVVIGEGDRSKATKSVVKVWGSRIAAADIAATRLIAATHFASLAEFAARFAPSNHKGDDPLDAGEVAIVGDLPELEEASAKLLLRSPSLNAADLGAAAAEKLFRETGGQILVICPSKVLAAAVVKRFESGAARLDAEGAWAGFRNGSVGIGVTTRNGALWSPDNLGAILVVEEDHPGHVELRTPNTNARNVAIRRAEARGVPICLTSAAPTGAALGAGVKVTPVGPELAVLVARGTKAIPAKAVATVAQALRQGKTAAVIARTDGVQRRCGRCSDIRVCVVPDCKDGRCGHDVPPVCPKCSDTRTYTLGVDTVEALGAFPEGTVALGPADKAKEKFDVVVSLSVDAALRRPGFNPEHAAMRALMAAGEHLAPGGTLVVCTAESGDSLPIRAAEDGQLTMAKAVWKRCSDDKLAPFGMVVKLEIGANYAPDVKNWPGAVLGPLRVGPSQWEILVRLDPSEAAKFKTCLDKLRSQLKVRYQLL